MRTVAYGLELSMKIQAGRRREQCACTRPCGPSGPVPPAALHPPLPTNTGEAGFGISTRTTHQSQCTLMERLCSRAAQSASLLLGMAIAPPVLGSLPQRQSRSCLLLGCMCISQNFQLFLKLAGLLLQSSSVRFLGSLNALASCLSGMHVKM